MRKLFLVAVAVLALAGGYRFIAGSGGKAKVLIWASIPRNAGPYTVHVSAVDTVTGETLQNDDTPVVGEYGPATLYYDAGHPVRVTVTARLGRPLPSSSWVRLALGIDKPKTSCWPVSRTVTELPCTITTR